MDRTTSGLNERTGTDRRVLTRRRGRVTAVLDGGRWLQVRLDDGTSVRVAGDRTRPNPGLGPVNLSYADGQFEATSFPYPPD